MPDTARSRAGAANPLHRWRPRTIDIVIPAPMLPGGMTALAARATLQRLREQHPSLLPTRALADMILKPEIARVFSDVRHERLSVPVAEGAFAATERATFLIPVLAKTPEPARAHQWMVRLIESDRGMTDHYGPRVPIFAFCPGRDANALIADIADRAWNDADFVDLVCAAELDGKARINGGVDGYRGSIVVSVRPVIFWEYCKGCPANFDRNWQ